MEIVIGDSWQVELNQTSVLLCFASICLSFYAACLQTSLEEEVDLIRERHTRLQKEF